MWLSFALHLPEAIRSLVTAGVVDHPAGSSQAPQNTALAAVFFRDWLSFYEQAAAAGAEEQTITAELKGEIVGAVFVLQNDCLWQPLSSGPLGSAGALGAADWARRQGTGLG